MNTHKTTEIGELKGYKEAVHAMECIFMLDIATLVMLCLALF